VNAILQQLVQSLARHQYTFLGFGIEVVIAAMIYLHYRRFGTGLSSRQSFGPVLPFVALTTFLVIAVVRSSFALSLGLVGALSIVRFRTPVKDPDELTYIFLSIASGIGTAAGQVVITLVIVPLILILKTLVRRAAPRASEGVFLSLDVGGVTDAEAAFAAVSAVIRANATKSSFLRYEMHDAVLHVTAEAELAGPESMPRIVGEVRSKYPQANASFYDESNLPTP